MGKKIDKSDPCPCGSGKKYEFCCLGRDYDFIRSIRGKDRESIQAVKINGYFTDIDGNVVKMKVTSLDSIPTHNKNGLHPSASSKEMVDVVIDEIYKILVAEEVGMLADLVNRVVDHMNIIPAFTYRQIGEAMEQDRRFTGFKMQVFCLAGNDPIELITARFP